MSFSETVFLFILALLIFGPKKLPEIARQVGKYLNEFKRASNEFKAQIEQEISQFERDQSPKILPPSDRPAGSWSRSDLVSAPLVEEKPADASPLEEKKDELPVSLAASDTVVNDASQTPPPATEAVAGEPVTTSTSTSQESHA